MLRNNVHSKPTCSISRVMTVQRILVVQLIVRLLYSCRLAGTARSTKPTGTAGVRPAKKPVRIQYPVVGMGEITLL